MKIKLFTLLVILFSFKTLSVCQEIGLGGSFYPLIGYNSDDSEWGEGLPRFIAANFISKSEFRIQPEFSPINRNFRLTLGYKSLFIREMTSTDDGEFFKVHLTTAGAQFPVLHNYAYFFAEAGFAFDTYGFDNSTKPFIFLTGFYVPIMHKFNLKKKSDSAE